LTRLLLLAAAACATVTAQPTISPPLLASTNPGTAAFTFGITSGLTLNNGGFLLYINGTFLAGFPPTVTWTNLSSPGQSGTLNIQGVPTTGQIIALVPNSFFNPALPSLGSQTVQVTVTQNAIQSNFAQFKVFPPPNAGLAGGILPNASVGSVYLATQFIVDGTPPLTISNASGSLPPSIVFLPVGGDTVTSSGNPVGPPPGLYTISARFTDFWGAFLDETIKIQSVGTPDIGVVSSSAGNSYAVGTPTNLIVHVGPNNANPAFSPNILTFFDGASPLGTVSVDPATGFAQLNNVVLAQGTHNNVHATFLGDTNWATVTSPPLIINVNALAAPNLSLIGAPFTANYGGTLSAGSITISGVGPVPSGTLSADVNGTPIGNFNVNPGSIVTAINLGGLQLPATINAGPQTINLNYSGDTNYLKASLTPGLTVNKVTPTITIGAVPSTAGTGQNVALTATLKSPTLGVPGGTVTFNENGSPLAGASTVNLFGGAGTFNTSTLSIGGHSINASYPGDANFLPVISTNTPVTITSTPLSIGTTSLPTGTSFQPYSATIVAIGGTPPYIFSATGLPSGVNINPQTGVISGSPSAPGNFTVTINVTDAANGKASTVLGLFIALPAVTISTPGTLPSGTVGVGYSVTINTNGGTTPFTFSFTGNLPPGLTFISNGPLVTGTPTTTGTYTFSVKVSDSANTSDSRDFTITIKPPALSIGGGSSNPTAITGTPFSVNFGCTGGTPPYTFSVTGSLPPGVTFANCALSGTPTATGSFPIRITITDSTGASVTRDVTINVASPALALAGGALPDGQVGVAYTGKVTATGGVAPIKYSGTGLPDGLSLSSAGDITGKPTTPGQFSFRVTATDSSAGEVPISVSASYTINIIPPTLAFAAVSLPDGVVGTAYSGSLSATGGVKPYAFTASGLPDGLTVSATGAVSGTPSTAGTFTVSATVTDAAGASAKQTYTIKIAPPPLVIATASAPNGTVGTAYSVTFSAQGGTPPYVFSATGQPSTLTMSAGGTLSGTPAAPGTFTVAVTVKDANATTTARSYTITIALPPAPPLTVAGVNTTVNPAQQPRASVSISNTFPVDILVTLTLTFQADSGPPDPAVTFPSGATTATVTIPAGSLSGATDVPFQTGTVAGTITITAKLTALGTDVTPSPPPSRSTRVAAAAPVIVSATATRNATGFAVTIVGYVTDREMTTAAFTFNGTNLGTNALTIPTDMVFSPYLGGNSPPSAPYGTQFTYMQQFLVNGSNTAITSVVITLNNRIGASNVVTVTLN
jgi:hypothetical protein